MSLNDTLVDERLTLARYAERAYLDYAVSVVKGRALPDVCDGQKPVQRRILFAMREMGLSDSAKPRKSAAVVGDVLGKLHPHGDSSVYDALVRMAQDFSLRYPLIDGQGNFGSRDGDGAAAMRYTEARLTPLAQLLLAELDEGTVAFQPNYDGTVQEPTLLPARLPMVLLNGASGIAVGLATEIPAHNLREVARAAVALIRDPKLSHEQLHALLPGPDFPGGGQIISSFDDLKEIYAVGRGSIKVRARWTVEDLARGQWQMVVNELPPGTSGQKVLEEIEELTNPKIRTGKKSLTPEQLQLKQQMLTLLDAVRDESGKEAAVRLVFEPKSKNIDQNEFITTLLAHTSLESSTSINLVMVGRDGRPRQKNLKDILSEWVDFRFEVVTRRTQFRLDKVNDRLHILEGRLIAFLHIDRVIKIIRESDEPKPALMQSFNLSERQAEDILEIRLRQLARLEGIKIEQEIKEKRADQAVLEELLANPASMKKQVIKEIESDAKLYGDERRTLIQEEKKAVVELKVTDEPVTVVVSQKGWCRVRQGHGHESAQFQFKAGDALYATFECRSVDSLMALGSNGRVYSVPVNTLPGARGDGQPLTSLIELEAGSNLMHFYAGAATDRLLLASSNGYGFSARVADMHTRQRGGKSFMTLDDGARPLAPALISPQASALACLSEHGRLLVFGLDEVKALASGGRGVILQELEPQENLLAVLPISTQGLLVSGTHGGKERVVPLSGSALALHFGKRARKGKGLQARLKPARLLPPLS
ncbi:MAG: DNA topoisomerase IV subunit A [Burkholderiales bacterium]|nr:DNA topoisomerase IV subunit A [Burkholderiales bacterium]MCA3161671.1 DNA topoisomerase IV subunit A [Burkholderiales bacterium]MCA3164404.1 DNA topoisomerase IV subunit A [Burkholderiales bacterium]MCA3165485.1 DNA topoisomerase IV subunit A [Burkholderiales bacterium]MCA3170628.1 DNA topoisomerase IV subunit A [Burkholderiales bacterium]